MTKRACYYTDARGKFGAWLLKQMIDNGLNQKNVSDLTGIRRQTVSDHVRMKHKPQLSCIILYAKLFDADSEEIWTLVEEDWG